MKIIALSSILKSIMRSYWSHLQSLTPQSNREIPSKPIYRASAIFPVFELPGISSRLLFMGYWMLKRNIQEIGQVVTLRSQEGVELYRATEQITSPKCYRIELQDLLKPLDIKEPFTGSLEIEFYASTPMVFPFPAVVINYWGPNFSSVVHTAQRVYNDYDDKRKNSETNVPESGFNIYADEDHEPFISLINGCEPVENSIASFEFYNAQGEVLEHKWKLGRLAPYETQIIYPSRDIDLQTFLQKKPGSAKVHFQLNWVFPRLLVGNFQKSKQAAVITHTYYDCSDAKKESDYWLPCQPKWHAASLMIPVITKEESFTNIYLYPIYSPSKFSIAIEFFDNQGKLLGKTEKVEISTQEFKCLKLKELAEELGIAEQKSLGARIIADPTESDQIPARIKVAFDIGTKKQMLPCNICTNLQPFNPPLETKPKTFRWLPLLADYPGASVWIMNSSPEVEYQKQDQIEITFYRESDEKTIKRKLTLPPHGFFTIRPEEDKEVKTFLESTVGWMTAVSTNPYITTYYFVEHPSGIVGGDHGF